MLVADVLSTFLVILGFWIAAPAACLVLRSLCPEEVERACETASAGWKRSLAWGVAVWVPAVLAISILGKALKPVAGLLGGALVAFSFLGIAGMATRVGRGLSSPADRERPWMETVRGMACLEVVATVPVLGWFLVLPGVLACGAGVALRSRRLPMAPAAEAPGETVACGEAAAA